MSMDFTRAEDYFRDQPGFKLDHTHFRIGSKYHSDTFLYAKGLFQNSFYASRIGMIIANLIKLKCEEPDNKNIDSITIVSYERYSELLLGIIRNLLKSMMPSLEVLLCVMVEKEGEMESISYIQPHSNNYVVVVPIVSTGSTSERLKASFNKKVLVNNGFANNVPLDVVHIFHLFDPTLYTAIDPKPLYSIPVKWYKPFECEKCFDKVQSQPLIEADKSNLNPVAIFGMPRVKKVFSITDDTRYTLVTEKEIEKGKDKKVAVYGREFKDVRFDGSLELYYRNYSNDYRSYSHDLESFIAANREGIVEWLNKLVGELKISATDRIIIISPCHELTNLTFSNLVNDIVFGSAATMIHLEPDKEFPENFKRMNQDFLAEETAGKNKIFFVDDNLVTGKTFFSIYDLFRFTSDYGDVVLSGSIFLMNKASASTNERVIRASGRVHSYVSINQPQRYDELEADPITRKIARIKSLMNRCSYYHEEIAFQDKLKRFDQYEGNSFSPVKEARYLKLFISTHELYAFLSRTSIDELNNYTFDEVFDKCKKQNDQVDDRFSLLKVLTQSTFTMYHPLRSRVFAWLKDEVESQVDSFFKRSKVSYTDRLEHIIFLISRSVQMGNYWIVSHDFFGFLAKVFNKINRDGKYVDERTVKTEKVRKGYTLPQDMKGKIIRYYVELILNNGACAVKIKDNLDRNAFKNSFGKEFCDALLDESYIVLDDLFNYMQALGFAKEKSTDYLSIVTLEGFSDFVKGWLYANDIQNTSRFEIANQVAGVFDARTRALSARFAEYLWLKLFLRNEELDNHLIQNKTELVCRHLKKLLCPNEDDVGLFFIIRDMFGEFRLIYDGNGEGHPVLENHFDSVPVSSFFENLGVPLAKNRDLVFEYRNIQSCPLKSALNKCQELVIYRIASVSEDAVAGFIGFYSPGSHLDDVGRRHMLLLRRDLYGFIRRHYRSEEFIQWVLTEERQRFAYLSGHGRAVMMRLASRDSKFHRIVSILEGLQGLFVTGELDPSQIKERLDGVFPPRDIQESDEELGKLLNELQYIAKHIYSDKETGDIVEIRDDLEQPLSIEIEGTGKVHFNLFLIEYICFELIINAKKNRFQVVPGVFPAVFGDHNASLINKLSVKLRFSAAGLTIAVSGTGPEPDPGVRECIESDYPIKGKSDVSGLDLIRKLIKEYNSENRIRLLDKPDFPRSVFMNTVEIHLINVVKK